MAQIEFEQSLRSDFEMREQKDRIIADLQQKGKLEVDMDQAVQQTAQDLKDAWKEELSQFQLNDRQTEADRRKDTASLSRRLEDTLVLLVEHKLGNESHMLLPQGKRTGGETMRQTAERVLREHCGDQMQVTFYGNAPCGFYKYKYPKTERADGSVGAKVFFYRSALQSGNVAAATDKEIRPNFAWLEKTELAAKLKPAYAASVTQLIL